MAFVFTVFCLNRGFHGFHGFFYFGLFTVAGSSPATFLDRGSRVGKNPKAHIIVSVGAPPTEVKKNPPPYNQYF
jgi:hypothetical protein